jgi:hypothetical protein
MICDRSGNEAPLTRDSHKFVGIFWAVQEKGSSVVLLDHRCPLAEAEPYGDMLTCPHGHYQVWEQWRNLRGYGSVLPAFVALDEYEEWPRGRIVYSALNNRFHLYADAQILCRPNLLKIIHERFGLPSGRTQMPQTNRDSHYVSTRRLAVSAAFGKPESVV